MRFAPKSAALPAALACVTAAAAARANYTEKLILRSVNGGFGLLWTDGESRFEAKGGELQLIHTQEGMLRFVAYVDGILSCRGKYCNEDFVPTPQRELVFGLGTELPDVPPRPGTEEVAPSGVRIRREARTITMQGPGYIEIAYREKVPLTLVFEQPAKLEAVADVQQPVLRGAVATFDGSRSTGQITSYHWTLKPVADGCPVSAPTVELDDQKPGVTLLCDTVGILRVSDASTSREAEVTARVAPRTSAFATPFSEAPEGPYDRKHRITVARTGVDELRFEGGENVCAFDLSQPLDHALHPPRRDGTWADAGYTLKQVPAADRGPFRGVWYVEENKLKVSRKPLINAYVLPQGPHPWGVTGFHEKNKQAGTDVDGLLAAMRAHEGMQDARGVLGHSGLMQKALRKADPGPDIEGMMDSGSRGALAKEVDAQILKAEIEICEAAQDPLPRIWGPKEMWWPYDDSSGDFTPIPLSIGGSAKGYVDMVTCKAQPGGARN